MNAQSLSARQDLRMGGRRAHTSSLSRMTARSEALRLLDAQMTIDRVARLQGKNPV